jgi:hypothetical protein
MLRLFVEQLKENVSRFVQRTDVPILSAIRPQNPALALRQVANARNFSWNACRE